MGPKPTSQSLILVSQFLAICNFLVLTKVGTQRVNIYSNDSEGVNSSSGVGLNKPVRIYMLATFYPIHIKQINLFVLFYISHIIHMTFFSIK